MQESVLDNNHTEWIDIAKGIGIIFVVVGHAWQTPHTYIYWFHMPLFFVLSGLLFKKRPLKDLVIKRWRSLLVPYLAFLFMLTLAGLGKDFFVRASVPSYFYSDLLHKVYGGRYVGPFWFITCLFFTQCLYAYMTNSLKSTMRLSFVIALLYVIGHVNAAYFSEIYFPWNINTVAMAIVFFHIGAVAKDHFLTKKHIILALIIVISAVYLQEKEIIDMRFDMYLTRYGIFLINVMVALSFIIVIFRLSQYLVNISTVKKVLSSFGKASLIILFLHFKIIEFIGKDIPYSTLIAIVIGLVLPLCLYYAVDSFRLGRVFVLGKQPGIAEKANG